MLVKFQFADTVVYLRSTSHLPGRMFVRWLNTLVRMIDMSRFPPKHCLIQVSVFVSTQVKRIREGEAKNTKYWKAHLESYLNCAMHTTQAEPQMARYEKVLRTS